MDSTKMVNEISIANPQKAINIAQLEQKINDQIAIIAEEKAEYRATKSQYDDTFKNDKEYRELDDKAKTANSVKNQYKKAFLKDPAVAEMVTKLEGQKDTIKDSKSLLSTYLKMFKEQSQQSLFETKDGQMCMILDQYKLVLKK